MLLKALRCQRDVSVDDWRNKELSRREPSSFSARAPHPHPVTSRSSTARVNADAANQNRFWEPVLLDQASAHVWFSRLLALRHTYTSYASFFIACEKTKKRLVSVRRAADEITQPGTAERKEEVPVVVESGVLLLLDQKYGAQRSARP